MGDAAPDADSAAMFRKPTKRPRPSVRPRGTASSDAATESPADPGSSSSEVVRSVKTQKSNPLKVSTTKDKGNNSAVLRDDLAHGSDRRIAQYDNKVTATNQEDTDRSMDAQAQYEAARKMWDDGGDVAADGSKVYRGQKAYRQYTSKSESFDNQVLQGSGPARAPVHYKASCQFDYKPDLCKDYKETGYCGFGDACKFMHDRSDYKSGWQLEKEWADAERQKKHAAALEAFEDPADGASGTASAKDDDKLPFACLICREPWHAKSNPVVTRCEHYFCEACALKQAAKTKRCFVCAENTGGIFNAAKALQEKIAKQKVNEEVEAACEESDEALLREYEEQKQKTRGYTGGWGIV